MPSDFVDDVSALKEMARGSVDAFEFIYKRYWNSVYNTLRYVLKNKEQSEDLAQEIFVKLWTNRKLLSDVQSLKTYLLRSAKNSALNAIRNAAQHARYTKEAGYFYEAVHLESSTVEEDYDKIIKIGLDRLAPRQRQIMKMSRVEGLSNTKIAEDLGLSKATVKRTITDSLKKMSEQFALKGINLHRKIS